MVDIQLETYLENLRKIGIKQELPLRITLPCPRCHKIEVYDIYENRYEFIENIEIK